MNNGCLDIIVTQLCYTEEIISSNISNGNTVDPDEMLQPYCSGSGTLQWICIDLCYQ